MRGASFNVASGERVGLVGPNGSGKSTILRLILSQESPDGGQVTKAKGARIGYLPQDLMTFSGQSLLDLVMDTAEDLRSIETELGQIASEIEALSDNASSRQDELLELTTRQGYLLTRFDMLGGYTLEAEARKILAGLGFTETDMDRPIDSFSGGWIMRAVLARLLLAGPDLLLLDEPTNHLDIDSLLWLENYLSGASSSLLLVSHDRTFLNNVVNRIVEIDRGRIYNYSGNYDQYLEGKEKRMVTETAAYENQQGQIKQVERFIERNRVRASTARRAQSRIKQLEKLDKLEAPVHSRNQSFNLSLPPAPRAPDTLVELASVEKSFGPLQIYSDLNMTVRRGDRIAFLGANGRGKSTLMKIIAGATRIDDGYRRVGNGVIMSYFAQFQLEELNPHRTVIEELDSVAGDLTPGRQRSILGGFLFRGDDVFKKVSVLSGGEKSRLILAKIMCIGPNLLLLDEPSNHLDIPARDMLEQALLQFDGTICLISHDRRLINAIANKVLVIQDGGVETLPGNFDEYQEIWLEKLTSPNQKEPASAARSTIPVMEEKAGSKGETRAEREARKKAQAQARQEFSRRKKPLTVKVNKLENRLSELGSELDRLSTQMADPEAYQDAERSKQMNLEYGQVKSELEKTTAEWEAAALELEELEESILANDKALS